MWLAIAEATAVSQQEVVGFRFSNEKMRLLCSNALYKIGDRTPDYNHKSKHPLRRWS